MNNNQESSLTSPSDRDKENKWRPSTDSTPLTTQELADAVADLVVKPRYPVLDRVYVDTPLPMQNLALFSFVPSSGATPDKDGFFGMAKIRGTFNTIQEADQRSQDLIHRDSYHKIFITRVGHPFPVTTSSKYSAESVEVDIKGKAEKMISDDVRKKMKEEEEERKAITDRAEKLKEDVSKEQDPADRYTTLQTKRAQTSWLYLETQKKLEDMRNIIRKTCKEIKEMDEESKEYMNVFYEKYTRARREVGIPTAANPEEDTSFMRFLVLDAPLDFDVNSPVTTAISKEII